MAAFVFAYWMWQYFLWDMHYHPGAGGPIPPPSVLDLSFMPLIAAGMTLLVDELQRDAATRMNRLLGG